jgi:hypothetical protein
MHKHEVMKVIAAQKEGLPHNAFIALCELREGFGVPGAENVRKGAVYGAEVGDKFGLVADSGADGDVKGARAADAFLDEVGEGPGAADVGGVGGVVACDGGVVFDEVVDADVRVGCAGR